MYQPLQPVHLSSIVQFFDDYFDVKSLECDPAFSRFIPMVYDPIGFAWRDFFDLDFTKRFNGLMLKGASTVGKVWLVSFPSDEVLDHIIARAYPGDLIFSHHPINMESGDPRGEKGKGFVPIAPARLRVLKDKAMSFYACHIPLDTCTTISTSDAIVCAIGGVVIDQLLPVGLGYAGRLCEIAPVTVAELIDTCQQVVGLPYVDVTGYQTEDLITRVAVIAGGAGDVAFYSAADVAGAQCLIAGEVTSKINNETGRRKQADILHYLPGTRLVAIGISHAGSEFLVMKELVPLIEHQLRVPATAVPESRWWR